MAADLMGPPEAPMMPQAMAPAYDWSGGYIGGQAAYGWGNNAVGPVHMYTNTAGTIEFIGSPLPGFNFANSGFIGGVEAGYNWQSGNMLLGIEADISGGSITGTYTDSGVGFSTTSNLNWLSTARVRLGLPVDRFLLFASGGLAVGGVSGTLNDTYGSTVLTTTDSQVGIGWSLGGGVAAAINSHWSVKAEYLYFDLGTQNYRFAEDPGGLTGFPLITTSAKTTGSLIRLGVDYKF